MPLADLACVELVLPSPHHGLRAMIDRAVKSHGVRLQVATEMEGLGHIKALVARGSGYTILAPAAAFDFVERGELLMAPIVEPALDGPDLEGVPRVVKTDAARPGEFAHE